MSWSGTVTCSHCYTKGHNKRKCEQLTAQIKDQYLGAAGMAAQQRAAGNDGDAMWYEERAEHRRQRYMKRTKIDLATGEKVKNKTAKAERMKNVTCGYCAENGHATNWYSSRNPAGFALVCWQMLARLASVWVR